MKYINKLLTYLTDRENYYEVVKQIKLLISQVSRLMSKLKNEIIELKNSVYEYFSPIFEMWEFWLNNPKEYFEVLKQPYDNPWWGAACTMPSFIAMVLHLVFWVINPMISDFILFNLT